VGTIPGSLVVVLYRNVHPSDEDTTTLQPKNLMRGLAPGGSTYVCMYVHLLECACMCVVRLCAASCFSMHTKKVDYVIMHAGGV